MEKFVRTTDMTGKVIIASLLKIKAQRQLHFAVLKYLPNTPRTLSFTKSKAEFALLHYFTMKQSLSNNAKQLGIGLCCEPYYLDLGIR